MVRVRKFQKDDDFRVMWKSIRGERRVVLDCEPSMLVELLNSSTEFGLTGQYNVSNPWDTLRETAFINFKTAHIPDEPGNLHRSSGGTSGG